MSRNDRFQGLVPVDELAMTPVLLVGAGAVGRQVGLALSQMGAQNVVVWDPDVVNEVNIGTQGWDWADLGSNKAEALVRAMNAKWALDVPGFVACPQAFGLGSDARSARALFLCVDSMGARRCVTQQWFREETFPSGFLCDARVLGGAGRIVTVTPYSSPFDYMKTLINDEDVEGGVCATRMTPYGATTAAMMMVAQYSQWLSTGDVLERDVSFNLMDLRSGPL